MTMPMMPGLTGEENNEMVGDGGEEASGGSTLEAVLEEIDDETMAEIVAQANEAYMNGELDEYMSAGAAEPAAAEEGGEAASEEGGDEAAAAETGDDAAAAAASAADPMAMSDNAAAMVEEIAAYETEVSELADAADDSDEGDAAPVKEALDTVVEALGEAEDAQKRCQEAADEGDAEACHEAFAEVEGAYAKAKAAVESAKAAAHQQLDDAAAEQEPSPLAMWAEKNA